MGRYGRTVLFADELSRAAAILGSNTFSMAALNRCWAARILAKDARDIKSVNINWQTVTTPGTVQLRIETVDAAGEASGSLYDVAATKDFTPTVGWQNVAFDVTPTTGLTPGTLYCVLLITTVLGTAHTLNSHIIPEGGIYPEVVMTAADGSTRSNLADANESTPIMTLVMDDDVEEVFEFSFYSDDVTAPAVIHGTNATALQFRVPESQTLDVIGFDARSVRRVGTPAGALRARIMNSAGAVVDGTTLTFPTAGLTNVDQRAIRQCYADTVRLRSGLYRLVFDSADSANSSNCWRITAASIKNVSFLPADLRLNTTTDVTASPITWTESTTTMIPVGLILDNVISTGGAGLRYRRRF